MKSTRKAFTLVELLVVIAILAVLASVAVVGYTSFIDKANDSNAETELHQIQSYVNANLMGDGEWSFTVAETTYTIKKINGKLSAEDSRGPIEVGNAIKACPDLEGLGTLAKEGTDLVYTPSNGKGRAVWKDILPTNCVTHT